MFSLLLLLGLDSMGRCQKEELMYEGYRNKFIKIFLPFAVSLLLVVFSDENLSRG